MKRVLCEALTSSEFPVKCQCVSKSVNAAPFKVFHIEDKNMNELRFKSTLTNENPDDVIKKCENIRVQASSKVNFSKLNPSEQKLRFINQRKEIKRLTKKLCKYTETIDQFNSSLFESVLTKVHNENYDLDDQNQLIENLSKAIITGKLKPNSLGLNQICTILRDVLGIQCEEKGYVIALPDKNLSVSKIEYDTYIRTRCTEGVLLKILGKEKSTMDDPIKFLDAVNGQTVLYKISDVAQEKEH